jgi:hypothetical protein
MPYSQTTITLVNRPTLRAGQVFLSWATSASSGTWFQVYVNQCLAWYGQRTTVWLPVPSAPCRIDIGSVDAGEQTTSFASVLAVAPARRCQLQWSGGTFLGTDIAGFHVYASPASGVGVDFTAVISNITAYPAGIATDGFGMGEFGSGSFGYVGGTYNWTSGALTTGSWSFAVRPYDQWGNEGDTQSIAINMTTPPRLPEAFGDGRRLRCCPRAFGQTAFGGTGFGEPDAVLLWNPSLT